MISPEGCASILFKKADRAQEAAEAMGVTAEKLLAHKLIDGIIPEPLGGAHRNPKQMAQTLRERLISEVDELGRLPMSKLLDDRYARLLAFGASKN